jgi:2-keto-3-deoxy-L-fuconate dehydrogenase
MSAATSQVAVVTGGASGIGAACVRRFLAADMRVAVLDRAPAPSAFSVPADVTDPSAVDAAVSKVDEQFGGVDILVNCAGIGAVGGVEANDDADWHRVLDVNVVGLARVCRAALPYLRRSPHAAIVNVSSIAAWAGVPNRVLYSASKGAVQAMTLAMAADLVTDGIRVNCVCPATVDTPWVERLVATSPDPPAERARLVARQPMGRLVSADEVAEAVYYLASPASAAITGAALAVDGGMYGLRLPARG